MERSFDGSIRVDTSASAPVDDGLARLENTIKSLEEAFGIKPDLNEPVDLGERSIGAAFGLAEARNVVDTAFGDMSNKMERFAAAAPETGGISELTAMNTVCSAAAEGAATDAASDMAVTGLSSDAADDTAPHADVIGLTGNGNSGGEARVYAPYIFGAEIPRITGYPSPSSYVQSPLSAAGTRSAPQQTLKIRLAVGGVDQGTRTFKTNGSSTVSVDWNDNTVSNGYGR
ncbi:MAG: hypothetical protein K2N38_03495 [Oscillospiraceae bacterium]|nr:hypothetical protein [Oscillospiraceae bacterium]